MPHLFLELSTISFVACVAVVTTLWWEKPKDVPRPIVLEAQDVTIAMLEVIDPSLNRQSSGVSILQCYRGFLKRHSLTTRLKYKRKAWHKSKAIIMNYIAIMVLYLGVGFWHVLAWNFDFPTPTEQRRWRIANVTLLFLPVGRSLGPAYAFFVYEVCYVLRYQTKPTLFLIDRFFTTTFWSIVGLQVRGLAESGCFRTNGD